MFAKLAITLWKIVILALLVKWQILNKLFC